ncbi:hypothetical protein AB0368_01710 [Actinoplanes sp. NPDC051475]|uniref:hypothetical protein n=1 Tax=Actinoplanes sp. NPDC051475 TaxID=3157225 RepID=UPI00344EF6F6
MPSSGSDVHASGRRLKNLVTIRPCVEGTGVSHWAPPLQCDAGRSWTYRSSVALYVSQKPRDCDRSTCASNSLASQTTTTCHSALRNVTSAAY